MNEKLNAVGVQGQEVLLEEVIERAQKQIDPLACVACIDWDEIRPGRAGDDLRQGRLLAQKVFEGVDWHQQSGTSASILSKILKKVPQDEKYEQVIQGFTDELTSGLLRSVMMEAAG